MELRADDVVAPDNSRDGAAIVGLRHEIGRARRLELKRMHEIGVQPLRPERKALKQFVLARHVEGVPAHMWNFELRIIRLDAIDLARDPTEARGHLVFAAAL